jgi:hypothetical protein
MAGRDLVRALARSARDDAPALGAKARALGRLADASRGVGLLRAPVSGALIAAAVGLTTISGLLGRAPALDRPAASKCLGGIEAPPGSCSEAPVEGSGSTDAASASSGGAAGWSASSSG